MIYLTNARTPKEKVYNKAYTEQEQYRRWLLTLEPEEILHHSFEYTVRNDILEAIGYMNLSDERCESLLEKPDIISEIYKEYCGFETGYMDDIRAAIENISDLKEYNYAKV